MLTRVPRRGLMLASGCLVLLIVVYVLAVRTVPGQSFEDAVLVAATVDTAGAADSKAGWAGGWAQRMLGTVSPLSLVLAILGVVAIGLWRAAPRLGLLAAGLIVASVLSGQLVRLVVERPILLDFGVRRVDQSFPSGHAIVALSVLCGLALVTPPRLRPLVVAGASTWATSVTVATVAIGWHRPSDTAGSGLIVLFWLGVATAVLAARAPAAPRAVPPPAAPRAGSAPDRGYRRALLAVPALAVTSAVATIGGFRFGTMNFDLLTLGCALALCASVAVALAAVIVPPGVDLIPRATVPTVESEKSC